MSPPVISLTTASSSRPPSPDSLAVTSLAPPQPRQVVAGSVVAACLRERAERRRHGEVAEGALEDMQEGALAVAAAAVEHGHRVLARVAGEAVADEPLQELDPLDVAGEHFEQEPLESRRL